MTEPKTVDSGAIVSIISAIENLFQVLAPLVETIESDEVADALGDLTCSPHVTAVIDAYRESLS